MKLRHRLNEVRAARRRVRQARRRPAACAARLHRRMRARPLTWVAAAGGSGLLAGCLAGRPHDRGMLALWHDPALRWLLRLLAPVPGA